MRSARGVLSGWAVHVDGFEADFTIFQDLTTPVIDNKLHHIATTDDTEVKLKMRTEKSASRATGIFSLGSVWKPPKLGNGLPGPNSGPGDTPTYPSATSKPLWDRLLAHQMTVLASRTDLKPSSRS